MDLAVGFARGFDGEFRARSSNETASAMKSTDGEGSGPAMTVGVWAGVELVDAAGLTGIVGIGDAKEKGPPRYESSWHVV